jgi:hypothetical protein
VAGGALEGARGNSGIILSQFFRGLSSALDGRDLLASPDLAAAFSRAAVYAREGISRPAEGTILTVLDDVARALAASAPGHPPLEDALRTAVRAAAESVERSPSLLPVLREAGVVDAGALGMLRVLEGFLEAVDGAGTPPEVTRPSAAAPRHARSAAETYGFCTEFLLGGVRIPLGELRARLEREGASVILVGDERTARVHLHTSRPHEVVDWARTIGTVSRVVLQDMDHATVQTGAAAGAGTRVVAVLEGEGFAAIARSLGADIASGADVASRGEGPGALIVLDAAPVARRAGPPAGPQGAPGAKVLPVAGGPQAVAALVAWRPDATVEENVRAMTRAATRVRTLEVLASDADDVRALRDRLSVEAVGTRPDAITVYHGGESTTEAAGRIADACRAAFPDADVQAAWGGQASPPLLVALE